MGATPRLPQSSRPHGPALLPAQQCPRHPPDSASPAKAKRKPTPTFSCRSSEPLPKERSQNAALHQSTDAVLQQKDYQHAATLLPGVRLQTKSRTSVTRAMNAPTPPTGRLPLAHPPSDGATRRCTADSAAAADEAALCGSALSNPLKKARSRSERRGKAKHRARGSPRAQPRGRSSANGGTFCRRSAPIVPRSEREMQRTAELSGEIASERAEGAAAHLHPNPAGGLQTHSTRGAEAAGLSRAGNLNPVTPETLARLQVTPTANPITVQKEGVRGTSVPSSEPQGWEGCAELPGRTSLASTQPLPAGKLRSEGL